MVKNFGYEIFRNQSGNIAVSQGGGTDCIVLARSQVSNFISDLMNFCNEFDAEQGAEQ